MNYEIKKQFRFEAAHILRGHDGQCARLHGHSYRVEVSLDAGLMLLDGPKAGMVRDFGEISAAWKSEIESRLDHRFLVAEPDEGWAMSLVDEANPELFSSLSVLPVRRTTAENLAKWLFDEFNKALATPGRSYWVESVTVWETETGAATYKRDG